MMTMTKKVSAEVFGSEEANLPEFDRTSIEDIHLSDSLSLYSLARGHIPDAAVHKQQELSCELLFNRVMTNDGPEMEEHEVGIIVQRVIKCLHTEELASGMGAQVQVMNALSDPESAEVRAVGDALDATKIAPTDGVYFNLRYQRLGQRLKKTAADWYASKNKAGLNHVKSQRVRDMVEKLPLGLTHIENWDPVVASIEELAEGDDGDYCVSRLDNQRNSCLEGLVEMCDKLLKMARIGDATISAGACDEFDRTVPLCQSSSLPCALFPVMPLAAWLFEPCWGCALII